MPHDTLARVRRVSRAMSVLCTVGMIGLPIALAVVWTDPWETGWPYAAMRELNINPKTMPGYVPYVGFLITLIPIGAVIFGLMRLRDLFRLYATGRIFAPESARCLKHFAVAVLLQAILQPITGAALSVLLTLNNPPGQRQLAISFGSNEFGALIIGGLILTIAWIMGESARIAEENAQIV